MSDGDDHGARYLFTEMEPTVRAWALVGFYIQQFAMLEARIDDTLAELLDLGPVASMIVNRNVTLADKVRILRSLADLVYSAGIANTPLADPEGKATMDRSLVSIQRHLEERNMVAHAAFRAEETSCNGAVFYTARANSKAKFELVRWPIETFVSRVIDFDRIELSLGQLQRDAKRRQFDAMIKGRNVEDIIKRLQTGIDPASE